MIKCDFVDIKNIQSKISKAEFDRADIEQLADLILATDGLIRPLILKLTGVDKQTCVEQYAVIAGDLEYHAAVRAKEKNLQKAEMVNAFVISDDSQQFAIEQLTLLSKTKLSKIPSSTNTTTSIAEADSKLFEQLGSQISAAISQQLQPLQQQLDTVVTELDRHAQILAALPKYSETSSNLISLQVDSTSFISPTVTAVDNKIEPKIEMPTNTVSTDLVTPKINPCEQSKSKLSKKQMESQPSDTSVSEKVFQPQESKTDRKSGSSTKIPSATARTKSKVKTPESPLSDTTTKAPSPAKTKTTGTAAQSNVTSDFLVSIDPHRLNHTLNLINTLQLNKLMLIMKKARIANAEILATNIIAERDNQPDRKFETWQVLLSAQIPKLTQKIALQIIEKLK